MLEVYNVISEVRLGHPDHPFGASANLTPSCPGPRRRRPLGPVEPM